MDQFPMKCWALQWAHWGDVDDFWVHIFYTRRDAITYALEQLCYEEDIVADRRRLWRKLRRDGVRVVKAELRRG